MSDTQINEVQNDLVPCAICGGKKAEHVNSVHAYTTRSGDLRTPEKPKQPTVIRQAAHNSTQVERLVEVLLDKGAIDADEVMYIFLGRGRTDGN